MATKKIMFPRDVIERKTRYDFSDDGTSFRGYLYKNTIPITYARRQDNIYASIRLDYLMSYADYRGQDIRYNICNGINVNRFDMTAFLAECEKAYNFYSTYNSVEAKKERLTKKIAECDAKITSLINTKSGYLAQLAAL